MFLGDGDRLAYFRLRLTGRFEASPCRLPRASRVRSRRSEKRPTFGSPSPDGSHVAYFVADGDKSDDLGRRQGWQQPAPADDRGLRVLSEQFNGSAWSPDGKELLYESTRTGTTDLWIVPIDGGKPRQLTHDVRNDYAARGRPTENGSRSSPIADDRPTSGWCHRPAASSARHGHASRGTETAHFRPGNSDLVRRAHTSTERRVDGRFRRRARSGGSRRIPFVVVSSTFAPDGKQFDFVIDRGGWIQDLAVAPIAGGTFRTLTTGGGSVIAPSWSPSGVEDRVRCPTGPVTVTSSSSTPRAARRSSSRSGRDSSRSRMWALDDSWIYFISDHEAKIADVWKVSPAGGDPVRVTHGGAGEHFDR